jgi:hypothetical protein
MRLRRQAAVVLATVLVAVSVRAAAQEPVKSFDHVTYAPLAALLIVLLPALAAAQEPVKSFDQLNTRLKPGDTVWVTDMQGREIKGKIQGLAPNALTLNADGAKTLAARDISAIREREPDSLKNGALIGLGVGGGLALVACLGLAEGSGDSGWCAAVVGVYGAVGAGIGVGIDALIPGKKRVAYRAPGAAGSAQARLSFAPVITPRAKGVAVAFSF